MWCHFLFLQIYMYVCMCRVFPVSISWQCRVLLLRIIFIDYTNNNNNNNTSIVEALLGCHC